MNERRELQNLIHRLLLSGDWPVDKRDKWLAEQIIAAGYRRTPPRPDPNTSVVHQQHNFNVGRMNRW